jgi:hypothetical protein
MKAWLLWAGLLLLLTLSIRLLADYQQQNRLVDMKMAPAVLEHIDSEAAANDTPLPVDDWRGKTGLPSVTENQLLEYLHLKLGESDDDPSALQAEDLVYLGAFEQDEGVVRYWLLPHGYSILYGTVTLAGGDTPAFGVASTPPSDEGALATEDSDGGDAMGGVPMEPDDDEERSDLLP